MEHRQFVTTRIYGYVPLLVPLVAAGVRGRLLAPSPGAGKAPFARYSHFSIIRSERREVCSFQFAGY